MSVGTAADVSNLKADVRAYTAQGIQGFPASVGGFRRFPKWLRVTRSIFMLAMVIKITIIQY